MVVCQGQFYKAGRFDKRPAKLDYLVKVKEVSSGRFPEVPMAESFI